MDYKRMYQQFNRHRKTEFDLCEQAMRAAVHLYTGILEADKACGQEGSPNRSGCNELCVLLGRLHEAMESLDQQIEDIAIETALESEREAPVGIETVSL